MAVDERLGDQRLGIRRKLANGNRTDPDGTGPHPARENTAHPVGTGLPLGGGRRLQLTRQRLVVGVVGLIVLIGLVAAIGTAVGSSGDGASSSASSSASRAAGSAGLAVPVPAQADIPGGSGVSGGSVEVAPDSVAAAPVPSNAGVAPAPSGDSGAARPSGVEPRIVWTGSVSVEVPAGAVDPTIRKISAAAQGLGGYLSANQVTGTATTADDVPQSATVTVRVPAASFGKLQDTVGGVGTVTSSSTSSQDVTAQYVDLQARLDALTTSRGTYLTLLSKATTVGDILAVQQQIDGVQTQIEQIEGQRKVLADQSDLGTLTIALTEKGAQVHKPGKENGFVHAFRLAGRSFLRGLEGIISALGVVALIALVIAVLYLLYLLPARLRRRGNSRRDDSERDINGRDINGREDGGLGDSGRASGGRRDGGPGKSRRDEAAADPAGRPTSTATASQGPGTLPAASETVSEESGADPRIDES